MKQFLSFLGRFLTRPFRVRTLDTLESSAKRTLSPSDRVVIGLFAFLMTAGSLGMLAAVSTALTVEVPGRGGTHVEGVIGSPRFVNPLLAASETDRDLVALVFSGLMKQSGTTLVPDLAESYTVSEDGKTYTFILRSNAVFHDGTPITADDIVFTVHAAQNPDIKSPRRANWEGVTVTAIDAHTVTFVLKSPYALFLENTTLGIVPKHLWDGVSAEEFPFSSLNIEAIGTGPYKVESVQKNKSGVPTQVNLVAFARAVRVPYIEHFMFRFYDDTEALTHALMIHDIDAANSVSPSDAPKGTTIHEAVFSRVFAVFFNQNENPIFADQAVRKALDTALDKDAIIRTILGGYGAALSGPLPPFSVSGAQSSTTLEERLATARAILVKDGWTQASVASSTEGGGVFSRTIKKQAQTLTFSITTASAPELKGAAEAVAGMWRSLGANVTVKSFEQNDLNLEAIRPRKYDALLFGLVIGREPDLFAFWHSSQRNDPGLNIGLYANIAVDKLLERARSAPDSDTRDQATKDAASTISAETAAAFLYAPYFVYATEPELQGIVLGEIGTSDDRFANVEDWYLVTERVWPFLAHTNN